ncbi:hypothetical protein Agub_g10849 [Astrephomene gubernaculifera]|uniref:CRAL-TRIO domain-containing protein n=1 Tax=Astrephomene gubernaculifera TaxID=47775 RepID=A0AAD3E024_9CHLO|nr:hypothetical protein Agub_g10849 [Astrephomene gubernaculifera]
MEQAQQLQLSGSQASSSCASGSTEPPRWSPSSTSDASSCACTPGDNITIEQVNYVRRHLEAGFQADDATIVRFIRATGGNLSLSIKRLNTTLAWRAQFKPEQVVCRACVREPRSHYMHLVGYCTRGRPIIYSCLENARNRVFEDNRDHMIQTFEWAIKCMPPGVDQWIWVCDFKGFGMADVNPKLAKLFLDISAEHYPERLGLFLVVDAPALFGLLWKAISAFVDPKTYKKIRFLPFDAGKPEKLAKSSLKAEMDMHFDTVTTTWLLREMAENRDKAKVARKVYNMFSMYERAMDGELCDHGHDDHKRCHHGHLTASVSAAAAATKGAQQVGAESGVNASSSGGGAAREVHVHATAPGVTAAAAVAAVATEQHNLLGTPALLHSFNTRPELLLPQATATA